MSTTLIVETLTADPNGREIRVAEAEVSEEKEEEQEEEQVEEKEVSAEHRDPVKAATTLYRQSPDLRRRRRRRRRR